MTHVKCKVESCYYWDKGSICKADTIMVDNNMRTAGRMEAGDLTVGSFTRGRARDFEAGDLTAGSVTGGPDRGSEDREGTAGTKTDVLAKTSHETLCSTFRPKNAGPAH